MAESVRVLGLQAAGYPPQLREIENAPRRLFVVGRDPACCGLAIGIVGSRRPTAYGREVARALARDLASAGACIVSGMARGIDAAAHEGALEAGGSTIAVLAGGPDRPYPAANRSLYARIVATGAVVSERPPGTPNHAFLFVERNRIIAGLTRAVVVVQAVAGASGALITARRALEQGREVLAVPGDIRSGLSSGPHALIKDGAAPCTGAGDVLEAVGLSRPASPPQQVEGDVGAVLEAVGLEPSVSEAVVARTGLDPAAVARILAALELRGLVGRGPSGTYSRLG